MNKKIIMLIFQVIIYHILVLHLWIDQQKICIVIIVKLIYLIFKMFLILLKCKILIITTIIIQNFKHK